MGGETPLKRGGFQPLGRSLLNKIKVYQINSGCLWSLLIEMLNRITRVKIFGVGEMLVRGFGSVRNMSSKKRRIMSNVEK